MKYASLQKSNGRWMSWLRTKVHSIDTRAVGEAILAVFIIISMVAVTAFYVSVCLFTNVGVIGLRQF